MTQSWKWIIQDYSNPILFDLDKWFLRRRFKCNFFFIKISVHVILIIGRTQLKENLNSQNPEDVINNS